MKLKLLSYLLSIVFLCSIHNVNAGFVVAGELIASPGAIVSANGIDHKIGSKATSYIEGDLITTGFDSNAKLSLSSGGSNIIVAPNSKFGVRSASDNTFILQQGAFSVIAKTGHEVIIETPSGVFKLSSDGAVNAIARLDSGSFAAISQSGQMSVEFQDGAITFVETGNAYVFNQNVASSVDVQTVSRDVHEHQKDSGEFYSHAHDDGLLDHNHASGYFTVNNALIVGGLVAAVALLSGTFSSDDGEVDVTTNVASPSQ